MVNRYNQLTALFKLDGQCILCGGNSRRALDICQPCEQELPVIGNGCQRCSLPLLSTDSGQCGQCLQSPPPFQRSFALWRYSPPIAQLIAGFKYSHHYSYGRSMAQMMAAALADNYHPADLPDQILPAPLHWTRRLKRGFNQSTQLATPIAARLHLPVCSPLKRIKSTPPQQSLGAARRQQNLRGAFAVCAEVTGQRLAIVDDVMTTGATAAEMSRCLLAAGAKEIHIWCLARTPH